MKIIDPATKEILPIDQPGELCTRGYNTMLGYWNDPQKTSETIKPDRWLHSGLAIKIFFYYYCKYHIEDEYNQKRLRDIGVLDENGYGRIVGRIKDMIIRGGENIYPREIEELLHTHPAVLEAHVNELGQCFI